MDFCTFLNKKKLHKNSPKILTVFRKTVEDGLNPPLNTAYPPDSLQRFWNRLGKQSCLIVAADDISKKLQHCLKIHYRSSYMLRWAKKNTTSNYRVCLTSDSHRADKQLNSFATASSITRLQLVSQVRVIKFISDEVKWLMFGATARLAAAAAGESGSLCMSDVTSEWVIIFTYQTANTL